ncbi:hypothetical protein GLOIN_2v1885672 [Rhizophagus clarus]|uniref:Uncharacterized protein n=1 Tax=Rhizophagus clarus TaxID=94130 RepID=A0A8H3L6G2_9GLOM|nr:hypothetical protein GLOIN_2v1885672 [Rhizophagus clarus]
MLFEFLNPFLKLTDRRVFGAVDISSERENYIEKILEDLKKKEITVCAIVTDSTLIAHQHMQQLDMMSIRISNRSVSLKNSKGIAIVESRRQAGEELPLPHEIFEIINSPTFWSQITIISQILDPYCKLSMYYNVIYFKLYIAWVIWLSID